MNYWNLILLQPIANRTKRTRQRVGDTRYYQFQFQIMLLISRLLINCLFQFCWCLVIVKFWFTNDKWMRTVVTSLGRVGDGERGKWPWGFFLVLVVLSVCVCGGGVTAVTLRWVNSSSSCCLHHWHANQLIRSAGLTWRNNAQHLSRWLQFPQKAIKNIYRVQLSNFNSVDIPSVSESTWQIEN